MKGSNVLSGTFNEVLLFHIVQKKTKAYMQMDKLHRYVTEWWYVSAFVIKHIAISVYC